MFPPFNNIARVAAGMPEGWYVPLTSPLVTGPSFVPVPVSAPHTSHLWQGFAAHVGPANAAQRRKDATKVLARTAAEKKAEKAAAMTAAAAAGADTATVDVQTISTTEIGGALAATAAAASHKASGSSNSRS
jgi:hypothetical protein